MGVSEISWQVTRYQGWWGDAIFSNTMKKFLQRRDRAALRKVRENQGNTELCPAIHSSDAPLNTERRKDSAHMTDDTVAMATPRPSAHWP